MPSLLSSILSAGLNRPRAIGRTIVGQFLVSTVDSPDFGPETAIIDETGAYPVERYPTEELAEAGHLRWVAEAASFTTGTTITALGAEYFEGTCEEKPHQLEAISPKRLAAFKQQES